MADNQQNTDQQTTAGAPNLTDMRTQNAESNSNITPLDVAKVTTTQDQLDLLNKSKVTLPTIGTPEPLKNNLYIDGESKDKYGTWEQYKKDNAGKSDAANIFGYVQQSIVAAGDSGTGGIAMSALGWLDDHIRTDSTIDDAFMAANRKNLSNDLNKLQTEGTSFGELNSLWNARNQNELDQIKYQIDRKRDAMRKVSNSYLALGAGLTTNVLEAILVNRGLGIANVSLGSYAGLDKTIKLAESGAMSADEVGMAIAKAQGGAATTVDAAGNVVNAGSKGSNVFLRSTMANSAVNLGLTAVNRAINDDPLGAEDVGLAIGLSVLGGIFDARGVTNNLNKLKEIKSILPDESTSSLTFLGRSGGGPIAPQLEGPKPSNSPQLGYTPKAPDAPEAPSATAPKEAAPAPDVVVKPNAEGTDVAVYKKEAPGAGTAVKVDISGQAANTEEMVVRILQQSPKGRVANSNASASNEKSFIDNILEKSPVGRQDVDRVASNTAVFKGAIDEAISGPHPFTAKFRATIENAVKQAKMHVNESANVGAAKPVADAYDAVSQEVIGVNIGTSSRSTKEIVDDIQAHLRAWKEKGPEAVAKSNKVEANVFAEGTTPVSVAKTSEGNIAVKLDDGTEHTTVPVDETDKAVYGFANKVKEDSAYATSAEGRMELDQLSAKAGKELTPSDVSNIAVKIEHDAAALAQATAMEAKVQAALEHPDLLDVAKARLNQVAKEIKAVKEDLVVGNPKLASENSATGQVTGKANDGNSILQYKGYKGLPTVVVGDVKYGVEFDDLEVGDAFKLSTLNRTVNEDGSVTWQNPTRAKTILKRMYASGVAKSELEAIEVADQALAETRELIALQVDKHVPGSKVVFKVPTKKVEVKEEPVAYTEGSPTYIHKDEFNEVKVLDESGNEIKLPAKSNGAAKPASEAEQAKPGPRPPARKPVDTPEKLVAKAKAKMEKARLQALEKGDTEKVTMLDKLKAAIHRNVTEGGKESAEELDDVMRDYNSMFKGEEDYIDPLSFKYAAIATAVGLATVVPNANAGNGSDDSSGAGALGLLLITGVAGVMYAKGKVRISNANKVGNSVHGATVTDSAAQGATATAYNAGKSTHSPLPELPKTEKGVFAGKRLFSMKTNEHMMGSASNTLRALVKHIIGIHSVSENNAASTLSLSFIKGSYNKQAQRAIALAYKSSFDEWFTAKGYGVGARVADKYTGAAAAEFEQEVREYLLGGLDNVSAQAKKFVEDYRGINKQAFDRAQSAIAKIAHILDPESKSSILNHFKDVKWDPNYLHRTWDVQNYVELQRTIGLGNIHKLIKDSIMRADRTIADDVASGRADAIIAMLDFRITSKADQSRALDINQLRQFMKQRGVSDKAIADSIDDFTKSNDSLLNFSRYYLDTSAAKETFRTANGQYVQVSIRDLMNRHVVDDMFKGIDAYNYAAGAAAVTEKLGVDISRPAHMEQLLKRALEEGADPKHVQIIKDALSAMEGTVHAGSSFAGYDDIARFMKAVATLGFSQFFALSTAADVGATAVSGGILKNLIGTVVNPVKFFNTVTRNYKAAFSGKHGDKVINQFCDMLGVMNTGIWHFSKAEDTMVGRLTNFAGAVNNFAAKLNVLTSTEIYARAHMSAMFTVRLLDEFATGAEFSAVDWKHLAGYGVTRDFVDNVVSKFANFVKRDADGHITNLDWEGFAKAHPLEDGELQSFFAKVQAKATLTPAGAGDENLLVKNNGALSLLMPFIQPFIQSSTSMKYAMYHKDARVAQMLAYGYGLAWASTYAKTAIRASGMNEKDRNKVMSLDAISYNAIKQAPASGLLGMAMNLLEATTPIHVPGKVGNSQTKFLGQSPAAAMLDNLAASSQTVTEALAGGDVSNKDWQKVIKQLNLAPATIGGNVWFQAK